jgi:hypothetical protein
MEEEEGFEPPRAVTPLSVFKTDPFSQTWVFLLGTKIILSWIKKYVKHRILKIFFTGFIGQTFRYV